MIFLLMADWLRSLKVSVCVFTIRVFTMYYCILQCITTCYILLTVYCVFTITVFTIYYWILRVILCIHSYQADRDQIQTKEEGKGILSWSQYIPPNMFLVCRHTSLVFHLLQIKTLLLQVHIHFTKLLIIL